ncbi:zinc ABC transporter substrate-binding protein [Methanoculleus bourgensis]|jgi:zinc transport system substrate-binding protein|uniref:Zinc ABC transporter solute-binding protein n=2 Tax=Methanoculleus bourgensis TaxID=83986 RepID=A0A7K4C320_9EURY|nr:zinc ABC transporter substrate-binding protein [Methanoculleus bourgensis]MBT0732975.1 zinc ABC transporter substrate-binding protein [Methanoculleus bourgensis]MDD3373036.1 zinc ABC transporter substrate-binding protein [Methanoculleus bourgensis]NMA88524.1 zinc ABC transporter solute-binding protein [Methanoculleus bourgensis]NQS78482.1 zinc ABC transporter solute-binding protein [Methanoculleus bourgensis]
MGSQGKGIVNPLSLVAAALVILMLAATTAGCTGTDRQDDGKIVVAVTIPPEQEFVERVGGDHVRVILLVPPGADPHTYEPPPGVIADLADADIYAVVGSGIEFELAWKDKIAAMNPGMLIVDCSRGIDLISTGEEDHSGTDPHIWLSPGNAKVMVENICQGLIEVDPANADEYRRNADTYQGELDALDREIAGALAESGVEKIMVYHPSWAYFARDYGLEEIPIENEGKEPSPRGIEHLIKQAKEEHITVIFASPEYSTRSAEVIADEIGGTVVLVSPLAKDYLANMRHVAAAFAGSGSP